MVKHYANKLNYSQNVQAISGIIIPRARFTGWQNLAKLVNEQVVGRTYGAYYIRDVALGYRTNSKIEGILERLGISKEFHKEVV